jgi:putative acetyltransferase
MSPAEHLAYEICRATRSDAGALAAAHRDSIHSIGPRFYSSEIVSDWAARLDSDLYVKAMERGEVFYIAVSVADGAPLILGFASYRVEARQHRIAVYVRGSAARRGIGSALFRSAEAEAVAAGATSIHVAASLAAVEFYRTNGFEDVRRGQHMLWSGRPMPCMYMRKILRCRSKSSDASHSE